VGVVVGGDEWNGDGVEGFTPPENMFAAASETAASL